MTVSAANFVMGVIGLAVGGVIIIRAQYLKTTAETLKDAVASWRQEAEAQLGGHPSPARGTRSTARLSTSTTGPQHSQAILTERRPQREVVMALLADDAPNM